MISEQQIKVNRPKRLNPIHSFKPRFMNRHHFPSGMGFHLRAFRFFRDQNNCDSSVAYGTCTQHSLSIINMCKKLQRGAEIIFLGFVSTCEAGKYLNTPNWSSMAEDAITQSGIGVTGSPV